MKRKLVRDKIPQIMRALGTAAIIEKVPPQKRIGMLLEKLHEEVMELSESRDIEEFADVYEVLMALQKELHYSKKEIEEIRKKKKEEKGGFSEGIILIKE